MSIISKISSFEFDKTFKFRKSAIIWGHEPGVMYPILYLSKPKHISQEDFEEILNKLEINIKI